MNKELEYKRADDMTDDEFEEAYAIFLKLCDLLSDSIQDGEYYQTCNEIFNAIEKKKLDISHIISHEGYIILKAKLLEDGCGGIGIGTAPKSGYNTNTAEGRMAFYRDHPDMNILF